MGGDITVAPAHCAIETEPTPAPETAVECEVAGGEWVPDTLVVVNRLVRQLPLVGSIPAHYWWLLLVGAAAITYAVAKRRKATA